MKADLHDLYISAAKELELDGGRKAIIIFVPFRQLKDFHKIQSRLVRELEKKFRFESNSYEKIESDNDLYDVCYILCHLSYIYLILIIDDICKQWKTRCDCCSTHYPTKDCQQINQE